jgi:hypothetical protein
MIRACLVGCAGLSVCALVATLANSQRFHVARRGALVPCMQVALRAPWDSGPPARDSAGGDGG